MLNQPFFSNHGHSKRSVRPPPPRRPTAKRSRRGTRISGAETPLPPTQDELIREHHMQTRRHARTDHAERGDAAVSQSHLDESNRRRGRALDGDHNRIFEGQARSEALGMEPMHNGPHPDDNVPIATEASTPLGRVADVPCIQLAVPGGPQVGLLVQETPAVRRDEPRMEGLVPSDADTEDGSTPTIDPVINSQTESGHHLIHLAFPLRGGSAEMAGIESIRRAARNVSIRGSINNVLSNSQTSPTTGFGQHVPFMETPQMNTEESETVDLEATMSNLLHSPPRDSPVAEHLELPFGHCNLFCNRRQDLDVGLGLLDHNLTCPSLPDEPDSVENVDLAEPTDSAPVPSVCLSANTQDCLSASPHSMPTTMGMRGNDATTMTRGTQIHMNFGGRPAQAEVVHTVRHQTQLAGASFHSIPAVSPGSLPRAAEEHVVAASIATPSNLPFQPLHPAPTIVVGLTRGCRRAAREKKPRRSKNPAGRRQVDVENTAQRDPASDIHAAPTFPVGLHVPRVAFTNTTPTATSIGISARSTDRGPLPSGLPTSGPTPFPPAVINVVSTEPVAASSVADSLPTTPPSEPLVGGPFTVNRTATANETSVPGNTSPIPTVAPANSHASISRSRAALSPGHLGRVRKLDRLRKSARRSKLKHLTLQTALASVSGAVLVLPKEAIDLCDGVPIGDSRKDVVAALSDIVPKELPCFRQLRSVTQPELALICKRLSDQFGNVQDLVPTWTRKEVGTLLKSRRTRTRRKVRDLVAARGAVIEGQPMPPIPDDVSLVEHDHFVQELLTERFQNTSKRMTTISNNMVKSRGCGNMAGAGGYGRITAHITKREGRPPTPRELRKLKTKQERFYESGPSRSAANRQLAGVSFIREAIVESTDSGSSYSTETEGDSSMEGAASSDDSSGSGRLSDSSGEDCGDNSPDDGTAGDVPLTGRPGDDVMPANWHHPFLGPAEFYARYVAVFNMQPGDRELAAWIASGRPWIQWPS